MPRLVQSRFCEASLRKSYALHRARDTVTPPAPRSPAHGRRGAPSRARRGESGNRGRIRRARAIPRCDRAGGRTAEKYHTGQLRKSGDAYITHPLAVATILAELGMTAV